MLSGVHASAIIRETTKVFIFVIEFFDFLRIWSIIAQSRPLEGRTHLDGRAPRFLSLQCLCNGFCLHLNCLSQDLIRCRRANSGNSTVSAVQPLQARPHGRHLLLKNAQLIRLLRRGQNDSLRSSSLLRRRFCCGSRPFSLWTASGRSGHRAHTRKHPVDRRTHLRPS